MGRLRLGLIFGLCVLASLYALMRMLWAILTSAPHAWLMAVAFDQLANAATNGSEDETISSRASRARREGRRWGCVLCRVLDWFDPDHCSKSEGT